jgi:hypothetical protein
MKILYPELTYGAIASSGKPNLLRPSISTTLRSTLSPGVTHAAVENWQYMEIIRNAADPTCSSHLVNSIGTIDVILLTGVFKKQLKGLFGLADLEHDDDFASLISVRH